MSLNNSACENPIDPTRQADLAEQNQKAQGNSHGQASPHLPQIGWVLTPKGAPLQRPKFPRVEGTKETHHATQNPVSERGGSRRGAAHSLLGPRAGGGSIVEHFAARARVSCRASPSCRYRDSRRPGSICRSEAGHPAVIRLEYTYCQKTSERQAQAPTTLDGDCSYCWSPVR